VGLIDLIDLFDTIEGHKAESPEKIESTQAESRPTPSQAAAGVSTPAIRHCGELMKEIEPVKNQHDAQADGGPSSREQAATPTLGGAARSSTPVKHTRRRALASAPPPHTGPLTDGQHKPPAFLYSCLKDGFVTRGTLVSQSIRTEPEALLCLRKRYPELRVQWVRLIQHPVCGGCQYFTGGVLCNIDLSPGYAARVGSCGKYTKAGEL
jgi:hypothetical protein